MRKHIFISLLLALGAVASVSAQNLEQVLDRHFEAIGQDKLLETKTLKATGKFNTMGMEAPFTMMAKRPDKLRMEINFSGMNIVQAFDGENAWTINPMTGSAAAVDMTGAEADGLRESADLDGQLWNYEEKGYKLELGGSETVDGRDNFLLNLTTPSGNVNRYYIDKENYMINRLVQKGMVNGMEMEVEVLLSDYREVNGFKLPFSNEQRMGGQTATTINFENIETGMELEDSLFLKTAGN